MYKNIHYLIHIKEAIMFELVSKYKKIILHLDNDTAGRLATIGLKMAISK